ncbi:hypothetical protein [Sporosarcina cyprini]|uniref:hypothetical protein n=1 Tax=Sporosarcina cyprini TaxID=2910523 RepID=UPI001EDD2D64|nr:hypothetical protein [Sporosarcina cyprini]MCG3089118.1 hypothetical protein [Sporosarcina cyprini]
MRPVDLWRKMIAAKVYTKDVASLRVNTVFAVGQLDPEEYTELIELIEVKYSEAA